MLCDELSSSERTHAAEAFLDAAHLEQGRGRRHGGSSWSRTTWFWAVNAAFAECGARR